MHGLIIFTRNTLKYNKLSSQQRSMSEIVVQHQMSSISSKSWREQVIFPSDDDIDVRLALDQYMLLNVYGASALQRQFVGRNIIPSNSEQLVYGISP